ncbi:MAG: DegV family protein [Anaerolineales bacterium]|jgi:DegV family protein with EDD domain
MPSFHVLTDSNCHLPASLCRELDIHVVPLPYVWEGQTYLDGQSFAPREFYRKFRETKELPKTSAPTPGGFIERMRSLLSDGKPILGVFVGSEFSSTLVTAQLAAKEVGGGNITLIDSETNAMALGFQALAAARLARDGGSIEDAVNLVERVRDNSGVVFAVPDLDHLRRGGRIGLAQSMLGSALKMVPILEIHRGPISPVERVRTKHNAIKALISHVEARLGGSRPYRIGILHSDAESEAWELQKAVKDQLQPDELFMQELHPILAIHVGPDAFGLAYSRGV